MPDQDEKPTALVVDDDPDFRSVVATILTSIGFKVVGETSDGNEALTIYAQNKPSITFLDIHMPDGMDGVDVLRSIMADDANAIVVMLTGVKNMYVYDDCVNFGAKGFVDKGKEAEALQHDIHALTYKLLSA